MEIYITKRNSAVVFLEDKKQTVISIRREGEGYHIAINRIGYKTTKVIKERG